MRVGFMQGRLCDLVDGKIQAFPWRDWESEFDGARQLGIPLLEWTLDDDRLRENPFMTEAGRRRIVELSAATGLDVTAVTGDCFMQAPFYKASDARRTELLADLDAIVDASRALGVEHIVVPLVDNGSLTTADEQASLLAGLLPRTAALVSAGVTIVFESDFAPEPLAEFIGRFPAEAFGINYDIGNSASLGFDTTAEIAAYGHRIGHVHVKDRVLGGTTVPLGEGDADFPATFRALRAARYGADFILQTARAADGDHAGAVARYAAMTRRWWDDASAAAPPGPPEPADERPVG